MSNKAKQALAKLEHALLTGEPLPLEFGQKKNPTPGNGRATFKTATAAANAARAARDEARDAAAMTEKYMLSAKRFLELIHKSIELDRQNTKTHIEALDKHARRLRFYCIMSWLAAGTAIGAMIFA